MVKKKINKMKRKKPEDRLGWKAEWIKEGGGGGGERKWQKFLLFCLIK